MVGLPDTIWFPEDRAGAPAGLPMLCRFCCFRSSTRSFSTRSCSMARRSGKSRSSRQDAASNWIWGAFRMSASGFRDLHGAVGERGRRDEYFGTLVNSYLAAGGAALGVKGRRILCRCRYLHGYRTAMTLLLSRQELGASRVMSKRRQIDAACRPSPPRSGNMSEAIAFQDEIRRKRRCARAVVSQPRPHGVPTAPSHFLGDYPRSNGALRRMSCRPL
jgi:glucose-1-phosphate thymidylyltransferase